MPPVDRDNPTRADYSESQFSLMEFMREFPDDAACLDWLWRNRFSGDGSHAECPKCERERKFHKVKERPAWDCDSCGHHLHPLAGTIFHKSSTSLQLWFFAIYLMTSTRCGVSAKQLERELGVTYKTAWRMFTLIRNQLMAPDDDPLTGWPAYNKLGQHVAGHSRVRHAASEYVMGDVHTNTVEGFFGHLKPSIRGTYRKVSHTWLQGYLSEFMFRYNERHSEQAMFRTLLLRACE